MSWIQSFFALMITLIAKENFFAVTQTYALDTKESDHLALLAIKSKIVDGSEGALSSWNYSFHFCQWEGVTCGRRHERVTSLDLYSKGLAGSLSPSIGNLSFLRVLRLNDNTLQGRIPTEIGRLFRLEQLILFNNSFEGNVPATLSNCTNLKRLSLRRNKFVGTILQHATSLLKLKEIVIDFNNFTGEIPHSIGNLTSLERLIASGNQFRGKIPHAVGQLENLQILRLDSNQLHGTIPLSFYNLSLLSIIYISDNQLVGSLPQDIGLKFPQLQNLNIWGNQFTGLLPVSLSNCSELEYIDASQNMFNGKIAIDFGKMPNLKEVGLFFNNFGSAEPDEMNFIASLVNCSYLQRFSIDGNKIKGQLPSSVGNLSTQLSYLSLSENFIYGSIPSSLMTLVGVETLILDLNQFTGPIPSNLGNLRKLQILALAENSLTGNIPESIGNLSLLTKLYLNLNRLQGTIPTTIGNCQNLVFVQLSHNNLGGSIPRELLGLSSLSIALNLAFNQLSGLIPLEIGKLSSLGGLVLSENKLAGEVPSSIGGCTSLENLQLQGNLFQGPIPSSFRSLTAVQYLDLSRNNFSGEIPIVLEKFPLKNLNLSFNDFEGRLPMNGIFKNATALSVVGNSRLCDGLPELHLPKCNIKKGEKYKSISLSLIIVIPILFLLLGLALALYWFFVWHRRRRETQSSGRLVMRQPFSKYSYEELLKATKGFSSQNLIGAGGYSRVYKGILEEDGVTVAVKVLNLDLLGALKSFMAECEAWRNIRHRNLLKILTACSSIDFQGNDFKALVYEFMPNGSLESWLHPTPQMPNKLSLEQRINIAMDVAHAIDYLHHQCETPIIHCDLKPSNILLDGDMVAHVGDFGLAKFLLPEVSRITQDSSIGLRGTIGYAPPEYGVGSVMSENGDVYSFGIVLLEMMTGKRPTDSMFQNGLNLHNYSRTGLPDCIEDILEPMLVKEVENEAHDPTNAKQRVECIISVVKIGIACSVESAHERMNISQVVQELQHITNVFSK